MQVATYRIDLEKITVEQFDPTAPTKGKPSIAAIDVQAYDFTKNSPRLS